MFSLIFVATGTNLMSDIDVEEEFEELMKSVEEEKRVSAITAVTPSRRLSTTTILSPSTDEVPLEMKKRKSEASNVFRVPQLEEDEDSSQVTASTEKRKKVLLPA